MSSSSRHSIGPDSVRSGVAVAAIGGIVTEAERPMFEVYLGLVRSAPGAALLVWGPDATCVAYNRAYRSIAALRSSALGKPLLVAQPEIERTWKDKLAEVFTGRGVTFELTGTGAAPGPDGAARTSGAEPHAVWLLPVLDGDGDVLGALALFMDAAPVLEPHRRVLQSASQEIKEALGSVRLIAERITRASRLTPERCLADMGRVLELMGEMDRLTHDMQLFARLTGGGVQVNPRPGDLGALVRAACDELSAQPDPGPPPSRADAPLSVRSSMTPPPSSSLSGTLSGPPSRPPSSPIRVHVMPAQGSWDPEIVRWIVINLVAVARKSAMDGTEVAVSVTSAKEATSLVVRGEGKGLREEEIDLFDPSKRATAGPASRQRDLGLGLFIARELVHAHGGRLTLERAGMVSFSMRVVFPGPAPASSPFQGASFPGTLPRRG